MVLNGGRAVFDYTGSPASDPATTIAGILHTGSSSQFQTGQIRTTNAPDNRHGIGWIDSAGSSKVTVAYTYLGDANVDGQVNTSDFMVLSQNYNSTSGIWGIGDFNYDGKVNALDFNMIATNFGATPLPGGAIGSPALGTVVPEPAALAFVGLAGLPLLRRRRRRG